MPEGDTIHTLAEALRPELVGRKLVGGQVRGREDVALDGRAVDALRVHGKHLFVMLGARAADDPSLAVRSHLGLHGSWHRYRRGEAWALARSRAALRLETDARVYVCFDAKEVDVLAGDDVGRFVRARHLGPDLVLGVPDVERLVPRIARFVGPDRPLVDLVLDQRVASGIGNVIANETLFAVGRHPLERVASLGPSDVAELFTAAHRFLRANVGAGPRVTRERDGRGPLAVYDRAGAPCFACESPIRSAHAGRGRRATFWCPTCQPSMGSPSTPGGDLDASDPRREDGRT